MMDTPSNENKLVFTDFVEHLSAKGFDPPIHILGNHDVDSSGFLKRLTHQKSVISSLSSGPRVIVIDDLKLAFVKFDSNTGGKLAQGLIGDSQFMEIGNEIDSLLNHRRDLTFIALVHHHPKVIDNPDWYEAEWYEAFLGNIGYEKSMRLVDADKFLKWIGARGIRYILHGHKHIPKVQAHEDITIIAAGSASGNVRHREEGKTYLTYNLIKYDIDQKEPVSCTIIAEQILGAGTRNILLKAF